MLVIELSGPLIVTLLAHVIRRRFSSLLLRLRFVCYLSAFVYEVGEQQFCLVHLQVHHLPVLLHLLLLRPDSVVVVVVVREVEVHVVVASLLVPVAVPCVALTLRFLMVVGPSRADVNSLSPPEVKLLVQVLRHNQGHEDQKHLYATCVLSEQLLIVVVGVAALVRF